MTRKKTSAKRPWKPLAKPPEWQKRGARCAYHFIMSYYESEPGTIEGAPYRLASGDWLVPVRLDSGRTVAAAVEALDPLPHEPTAGREAQP